MPITERVKERPESKSFGVAIRLFRLQGIEQISNFQKTNRGPGVFAVVGLAAVAIYCVSWSGAGPLLGIPLVAACLYGAFLTIARSELPRATPHLDRSMDDLVARNAELEGEIAERIQAETNLRRVQSDLSTAQRLAHLGSWRWSYVRDELIEGSEEYCRIHGVPPSEIHDLLAHQMERVIHPEDRQYVKDHFEQSEEDEARFEIEYRIIQPNGEIRHVREIGEIAHFDAVGNEWVGTVQDITEAKRLEQTLRSQSESLRVINRVALAANEADSFEEALQVGLDEVCSFAGWSVGHVYALSDGDSRELRSSELWHLDDAEKYSAFRKASERAQFGLGVGLPGRVLESNQPVWSTNIASELSATRTKPAVLAGLQSCFAFPVTVGRDVVAVLEFFSEREVALNQQTLAVVSQIGTQLGRVVERHRAMEALEQAKGELKARVEQRTAELSESNEALKVEISERKRAEEAATIHEQQLVGACKIAGLGFATWNLSDNRYGSVSEEFAAHHQYSQEEYLARFGDGEDYSLVHPDDIEHYKVWEDSFYANPKESETRFRALGRNGNIIYLREIDVPIFDDAGQHIKTSIVQQNISDIHEMEAQLHQAQKMEVVGQLTGGIAHDFNNLLAVILANLEMLVGGSDDPEEIREWAEMAIEATDRGANLTQRLLAFSRKQSLRPEALNVTALVQSMLEMLRRTFGETIDIQVTSDADLGLVEADPSQLENALLNLAINARDAMPGGGRLTIGTSNVRFEDDIASAQAEMPPGEYVLVSVTDTGQGMPKEIVDHVFEPFFSTKDVGAGTGLGLSMVYGFVKQTGGSIRIYSEEGLGTVIKIYLPRYQGIERQIEKQGETAEIPRARNESVLIVEDNEELRVLAVQMLESLGYEVQAADSGLAALDLLESPARFDLLLTDVVLPGGMSGCDLGKEAARLHSNTPVVFMSGYAANAAQNHGGIDRNSQFLQKPFRVAELAIALRTALDEGRKRILAG